MGTPIRQLVRRRLSPNILRAQKSPVFLNVPSPTARAEFVKLNNFVKCLNFPNSHNSPNNKSYHEDNDLGTSVLTLNENKSFDTGLKNFNITLSNIDSEISAKVDNLKLNENFDLPDSNRLIVPTRHELPFVNTPDRDELLENGTFSKINLNVLGKGSYGTVIQAVYKGQLIAVKIVSNKKPYSSLFRETNALRLQHSNIVETIKVVYEPLAKYGIVMMEDCSTSKNMQHILNDTTIIVSLPMMVHWILNICQALKHCHERGILHLDVKPKNILVQAYKQCKLCDFGNSSDMNCMEQRNYSHQGSIAYTAPELFQGNVPDCSADVYSLGITMWQIYSRSVPYKDVDNQDAVIYFVVKHEMRPTVLIAGHPDYQKLYTDCWTADPALRPSLSSIIDRLQECVYQKDSWNT